MDHYKTGYNYISYYQEEGVDQFLEGLIDSYGLANVLEIMANICKARAEVEEWNRLAITLEIVFKIAQESNL